MYSLHREYATPVIDYDKPVFIDTETAQDLGKTKGGLYGYVRLVQIYQAHWDTAVIYDTLFIPLDQVLADLKAAHLVFHNACYDLHTINLYTPELWLPRRVDDTFYLSKLAFPEHAYFDFYSCLKYAGVYDDVVDKIDKKVNQKYDWSGPLTDTVLHYAECDVTYLAKLYDKCKHMQDTERYKLDQFHLGYAIEYSRRGIPVNQEEVRTRFRDTTIEMEEVLERVPVNPNSFKKCQELLGVPSTDGAVLMKMKLQGNELAGDISKARYLIKKRNFLKKYSRPIIMGFYNPCGTISGRWSCTGGDRYDHDNLQTIPRELLSCLKAPDGYTFVYKDYPTLELRMAVAWTGEPVMERLMRMGVDLHVHTASRAFGVPKAEVTPMQRLVGKVINFQCIYGASVTSILTTIMEWGELLLPYNDVKKFVDTFFEEYEYFKEWHNIHKRHLNVYAYMDIVTALGRKIRAYKLNDSVNFPIQGSSSEVTKMSLKLLKERYPNENLVATTHDSNTLLTLEDEAEDWVSALNECMVEAWFYVTKDLAIPDLPMPAEAKHGKIWDF